jgi:hypothetical protein
MAWGFRSNCHGDWREPKRLQVREVSFSLNPYAIIIDENQERVERGEKSRGGLLLQIHTSWKKTRHWKGVTHKKHERPTTCRVPRPRCTKCTMTFLKFSVMQLSLQEPKRCYGLQGTSIQGLRHDKTKRREETQDSPSFDLLAIATIGIEEVESKEQQMPNKPRTQSTSY